MFLEIIKFIIYSALIVLISKYILVTTLRKLAESLKLKPKTVGNIAGYATSIPELLTITTSSLRGLSGASVYNIISSNVINFIQYIGAILLNKNVDKIKNRAIFTILIPIVLLKMNIELNIMIVPIFVILYILFRVINDNVHKMYLKNEDEKIEHEIEVEEEKESKNRFQTIKYIIYLVITGFLLYFVGDKLGNTLETLCKLFNISEAIIGILLGFITSIPELMTFFESQKHYKKEDDDMLGVVEATNNLLTSNILNLFAIQTIGILITSIL